MRRTGIGLAMAAAVAGCTPPPASMKAPPVAVAPPYKTTGLERVIGQNAAGLTQLFGAAGADVREGNGRKLQFASGICVLDAYLYPKGSGEPVVTYLDARELDGSPIDRASCVAALVRKGK